MGRIGKIISSVVDTFLLVKAEIYPNYIKEARAVYPPGYEGVPLDIDQGAIIDLGSAGKSGFIGVFPLSSLDPGECRIYARDSNGDIKGYLKILKNGTIVMDSNGTTQLWVKDGEIALSTENPGDWVALASLTKSNDDKIQSTFDPHSHTTTATIGPSGVPGIISPPITPIGALPDVKSGKVKSD